MKKSLTYLVFFILSINFVLGIGVYELNGEFVYYTSNSDPTININITTPFESINLTNANLKVNDFSNTISIGKILATDSSSIETFNLEDFGYENILNDKDDISFKLTAVGVNDGKEIKTNGDPAKFKIKIDETIPSILSPINLNGLELTDDNRELNFVFSELISSYTIRINGNAISYSNPSREKRDFSNTVSFNFNEELIREGNNEIIFTYYDIAGNQNNATFGLKFRGEDLSIELLTNKDDSSLKYFYDKNFADFFENKIYYSESPFTLKIETNKEANCFISTSRTSFATLEEITNRNLMNSNDGFSHSHELDSANDRIWLACQGNVFEDEIVYLSEELNLGRSIIEFELYNKDLNIDYALPDSIVSSNPFNVNVKTTDEAICKYRLDSLSDSYMNSTNFIDHIKINVETSEGSHSIFFECFNKIGVFRSQTNSFEVDTKNGVRIISFNPKYPSSSSENIRLTLSEDALCKISKQPIATRDFDNATTLEGEGNIRNFNANSLVKGDNFYYIRCQKNGELFDTDLNLIYDPDGPQVSNLRFKNNGIESDFVGSTDRIEFLFDVESLIPINKNFAGVELENETLTKSSSKESFRFSGELIDAKSIWVISQSDAIKNSTRITKNVKFDLDKPILSFDQNGDSVTISCFDEKSGCHEIRYSLSMTQIDCNPKIEYFNKSEIKIGTKNYICAFALDKAGNFEKIQDSLKFKFDNEGDGGGGGRFNDNQTNETLDRLRNDDDRNEEDQLEDIDEDYEPFLPNPNNQSDSNGNGLLIFAALLLVLAGIGGGGYYAYNKGYLDNELKRFGIVRNQNKKSTTKNNGTKSTSRQSFQTPKSKAQIEREEKNKYDRHLSKLNNFIDETLNKGSDVFDNFKKVDKGKVEGYDDTLIKKPKTKKSEVSKEEFDDFYSKSKGLEAEISNNSSVEKEAEAFENYYKDKKTSNKKE